MDYWGCDADGMFCSNTESLSRSKNEILNWNFGGIFFGVQDSARKQLLLGGTNPVALVAEDRVAGLEVGGISDSRSADKSGSRLPQRSALPLLSSAAEPSLKQSRRGRAGSGENLRNARCQVYGCNKDLGSCKDYHKRHKVCEVHTKTSKVIVNAIEQRFCQQCSRFHLLAEFDDGKRSCRKRLAGHNARRRKPRPSLHSIGSSRKMLLPHYGTECSVDSCPMPSFIRQDMFLSHNPISSTRFGKTNGFGVLKQVPGLNYEAQSAIGFLPNFPCRSFDELAFDNGGGFSATGSQFRQQPNAVLQLLNREDKTPLQSDGVSMVDSSAWTTDQGLPGIPKSARALSLLSSQSQTCSDHAAGIPVDRSSVVNDSESPCMTRPSMVLNQQAVADGLSGVFLANRSNSLLTCDTGTPNRSFPFPGLDLRHPENHLSTSDVKFYQRQGSPARFLSVGSAASSSGV